MDLQNFDPRAFAWGAWCAAAVLAAAVALLIAHSHRRPDHDLWRVAWLAESAAVAVGLALVFLDTVFLDTGVPGTGSLRSEPWLVRPLMFVFAVARTLFATLLVRGLELHLRPKATTRIGNRQLAYFAAFWGLLLVLAIPDPRDLPAVQAILVGVVLAVGGLLVLRSNPGREASMLPMVVASAGVLSALGLAGWWGAAGPGSTWGGVVAVAVIVDLVIAVASLRALERARAAARDDVHQRLEDSYDSLRKLADVDPLTGLSNRTKLREVFDQAADGSVVAIELEGFQQINDTYGLEVGDGCLTWLARTVVRAFRPTDHVFRLGSDEFLVLAPGLDASIAQKRIQGVAVILGQGTAIRPPLYLSYGIASTAPGVRPEVAMREAEMNRARQKELRAAAAG